MASRSSAISAPFTTDDGQCLNCCGLNFYAIFGDQPDCESFASISIKAAIANEDICSVCKLLVSAGRQVIGRPFYVTDRNGVEMEFVFDRQWKEPIRDVLGAIISGGGSLAVRIQPSPSPFDLDDKVEFYLCPMWLDEETSWNSLSTQFVSEGEIDLDLCRRWLADCECRHPTACHTVPRSSNTLPPDFRVVDVHDACIVVPPVGCRYVALSYVWGQVETLCLTKDNVTTLEHPGVLDRPSLDNAQTILDAMIVVSRMGERYLWVDRLCIAQDSPAKVAHLRSMDIIYSTALLTLVAADGRDANAGLPGVIPGSRSLPQLKQVVGENLALTVSCAPPIDLTQSAWSSRGWTCQEQLLSRRFLIFSAGQALWQCGSCFLCEDTEVANKPGSLDPLEQVDLDIVTTSEATSIAVFTQPQHLYRPKIFSQYSSIVSGFTKRILTYQRDVLPAFQGFGSVLERTFNCSFIAGIPESYLDQALLWLPVAMQRRRVSQSGDCPSWSWAGWVGESCYAQNPDLRERVVPVVRWHVLERNGTARLVNGTGIGIREANLALPRTLNTFLWIPLFELLAGRVNSGPEIHHPPNFGPFLQLWTSCAFFRITIRLTPPDQIDASKNPFLTALVHSASSQAGQYAGHVILNGAGPLDLDTRRHEFVVISEAQYAGYDVVRSRDTPSDTCNMYNVLLVEWDEKREVAYRLGIGRILKKVWNAARPGMKFVKLG